MIPMVKTLTAKSLVYMLVHQVRLCSEKLGKYFTVVVVEGDDIGNKSQRQGISISRLEKCYKLCECPESI